MLEPVTVLLHFLCVISRALLQPDGSIGWRQKRELGRCLLLSEKVGIPSVLTISQLECGKETMSWMSAPEVGFSEPPPLSLHGHA